MKKFTHMTEAMQSILTNFNRGYINWISFTVEADKVDRIAEKWVDELGTALPSWKRQDRKQKNLANAVALSLPTLSSNKRVVFLMATEHVKNMPAETAWRKQVWQTKPPAMDSFVMVQEPREGRGYVWTWRLQNAVAGPLGHYLTGLIKRGEDYAVKHETEHWVRLYPMFGGVRRQLARILRSGSKLWCATKKTPWPGADPDRLPVMRLKAHNVENEL